MICRFCGEPVDPAESVDEDAHLDCYTGWMDWKYEQARENGDDFRRISEMDRLIERPEAEK